MEKTIYYLAWKQATCQHVGCHQDGWCDLCGSRRIDGKWAAPSINIDIEEVYQQQKRKDGLIA